MKKIKAFCQKVPKNIKILILALVGVVVLVFVVRAVTHKRPKEATPVAPVATIEETPVEKPVYKRARRRPVSGNTMIQSGDYSSLVAQYASRRMQFAEACQATPVAVTYKAGTAIMLDNRAGTPITLSLGNKSYTLGAYGYQIITLNTKGEFLVDCGSQQNVASIVVQQ